MHGTPSRFGLQIFGSKGILEIFTGYPANAYLLKDSSWSPGRKKAQWLPITSVWLVYDFDPVHGIVYTGHSRQFLYADGHVAAGVD